MGVSLVQLVWEVAWNSAEVAWSLARILVKSAWHLWELVCMFLDFQIILILLWLVGFYQLCALCVRLANWIIQGDTGQGQVGVKMRRKMKDSPSVREKVNCYESYPRTETGDGQKDVSRRSARSHTSRYSWNDFDIMNRTAKVTRNSWHKEEAGGEGLRKAGVDGGAIKTGWKKDWTHLKYLERSRNCDSGDSDLLNVLQRKKHARNKSWDSRNSSKFTHSIDIDIGEERLPSKVDRAISRDDTTINYNMADKDYTARENVNGDNTEDNTLDDSNEGEDEIDLRANYNENMVTFFSSVDMVEVLDLFHKLKEEAQICAGPFPEFFPKLKNHFWSQITHKYQELLAALDKKANGRDYEGNNVARGKKMLIIGAGPCGLRMAMEAQFLGFKTTVIEKRNYINRNNVLKLWAFVMEDLKMLGAKKIWPGLGNGCVNHVSIRMLQWILLKMALILGAEIRTRTTYTKIIEPENGRGWRVAMARKDELDGDVEEDEEFDVVVGATGVNVQIEGFERKSLDAKMSIAITANFVNNRTTAERAVKEIPGLSKQYDLAFFKGLETETGINLENIVYYQDLTHYFVMTAKKESLLQKKVIISDKDVDRESLLHPDNIDSIALEKYAIEAAVYSTRNFSKQLPQTCFAQWKGRNDVSIFDFTNLYASTNACRIKEKEGKRLLLAMVGDSLVEPFWPEGTGVGRGFLSVLDAAWLVKQFCQDLAPINIIREREKLYSLMRQTADNKLKAAYREYTINPSTRYPTTSFPFKGDKIHHLYETDVTDVDQPDAIVHRNFIDVTDVDKPDAIVHRNFIDVPDVDQPDAVIHRNKSNLRQKRPLTTFFSD